VKAARILGVGVDMSSVSRIEKLLTKGQYFHDRFLTGAFHPSEVEEYHRKKVDKVKY
jgi:phosphopantetheinyl transferase (holo-ACP synthase)